MTLTDASGKPAAAPLLYEERFGNDNPFHGIDADDESGPTFADLDNDGDFDLVVGSQFGLVNFYRNTGSETDPVFVQQTGAANPFAGIDVSNVGGRAKPVLTDIDGDLDLDLVVGRNDGTISFYRNTGSASAPLFVAQTGAGNPFAAIDIPGDPVDGWAAPSFGDLDHDGDLDLVVGGQPGKFTYFRNDGTANAAVFVEQTGSANPLNGHDAGFVATPFLADVDGDGDLDVVSGKSSGQGLNYYENTGTAVAPVFVKRDGADNPFNGPFSPSIEIGLRAPSLVDLDGDGDLDLAFGQSNGTIAYVDNTTFGTAINVTAENEVPVAQDGSRSTGESRVLNASVPAATDSDGTIAGYALNSGVAKGALTFNANGTFSFDPNGAFEALAPGQQEQVSFTYHAIDNTGNESTVKTVAITVTGENDMPALSGLTASVTFGENTVNAAPQIIDSDVTVSDAEGNFNGGALTVTGHYGGTHRRSAIRERAPGRSASPAAMSASAAR